MSDEISYDLRLEEKLEKLKMAIWINEEIQMQPEELRKAILETYSKLYKEISLV